MIKIDQIANINEVLAAIAGKILPYELRKPTVAGTQIFMNLAALEQITAEKEGSPNSITRKKNPNNAITFSALLFYGDTKNTKSFKGFPFGRLLRQPVQTEDRTYSQLYVLSNDGANTIVGTALLADWEETCILTEFHQDPVEIWKHLLMGGGFEVTGSYSPDNSKSTTKDVVWSYKTITPEEWKGDPALMKTSQAILLREDMIETYSQFGLDLKAF